MRMVKIRRTLGLGRKKQSDRCQQLRELFIWGGDLIGEEEVHEERRHFCSLPFK